MDRLQGAPNARYFLTVAGGPEREVSMAEFVAAERRAGFRNTMGRPDLPATGGFGNSREGLRGRVEYQANGQEG